MCNNIRKRRYAYTLLPTVMGNTGRDTRLTSGAANHEIDRSGGLARYSYISLLHIRMYYSRRPLLIFTLTANRNTQRPRVLIVRERKWVAERKKLISKFR